MPHLTLRRATCTLLLAAALLPPAVASASSRAATAAHPAARAAAEAPGTAVGWWHRLVRVLAPEGCGLDPHGICAPASGGPAPAAPAVSVGAGCGLDPHGLCSPSR